MLDRDDCVALCVVLVALNFFRVCKEDFTTEGTESTEKSLCVRWCYYWVSRNQGTDEPPHPPADRSPGFAALVSAPSVGVGPALRATLSPGGGAGGERMKSACCCGQRTVLG